MEEHLLPMPAPFASPSPATTTSPRFPFPSGTPTPAAGAPVVQKVNSTLTGLILIALISLKYYNINYSLYAIRCCLYAVAEREIFLMKSIGSKWLVFVFLLSLLAACGGSEGNGDDVGAGTVTATLDGTALSFVETADPASPTGYDPDMNAYYDSVNGKTYITVLADFGVNDFDVWFYFTIEGNPEAGQYPVGNGNTFTYTIGSTHIYTEISNTGSIDITTYGAVGGRIEGTFSFDVCESPCNTPLPFEGSFSMVRNQSGISIVVPPPSPSP